MAHANIYAGAQKLPDVARLLKIRAAYHVATLMKHQSDATHARTADADKMRPTKRMCLGGVGNACHADALPRVVLLQIR